MYRSHWYCIFNAVLRCANVSVNCYLFGPTLTIPTHTVTLDPQVIRRTMSHHRLGCCHSIPEFYISSRFVAWTAVWLYHCLAVNSPFAIIVPGSPTEFIPASPFFSAPCISSLAILYQELFKSGQVGRLCLISVLGRKGVWLHLLLQCRLRITRIHQDLG